MKKILIIAFLSIFIINIKAQDFHGVLVGISEYPYPNELPDDCVWDAEDMSYKLGVYCGWQTGNMEVLTDAYATEQDIKDAIAAMPRTSANSDMFFFSGHGSTSGLFTVDENYLSPSELQNAFGSTYNYYSSLLDACHSGVFTTSMSKGVISAACRSNEFAYCGGPNGHSVFTAYLCLGLQNNYKNAEDLHNYAAPLTTAYMSSMHPQLGDYFTGNFASCIPENT